MQLSEALEQYNQLAAQLQDPAIAADPDQMAKVSQQFAEYKQIADAAARLEAAQKHITDNEAALAESDAELVELAEAELVELQQQLPQLEK